MDSNEPAHALSNNYNMSCPPVRGDNPRALASGLSYVQVDKHGIAIFFSVELTHHEIFCAKVGKGGISNIYTIVCPHVREKIHSLKLMDYLHVLVDKPWHNYNTSPALV